ncbi:UDP-N-acetylglucosamine 2-epimerase (non-hydrolyzing) [Pseudenhygromyxa sp. WMMC2535]|uniref:non-hydrolyzing UDP-N-acetylglucosamine 2-epimerase n=1 Tax=Pseudenhygromyxa sp. WMMC2535 TaxID=2712867 RepID=UPI00155412BF|nr:UDP-N-acetylglucosamine 2-epimerase (non-hydrolyzing) [Pseudenhygromyxa sp. WMMC2535]NVB41287.1 UDP-N-acetylglucosamine 2-epimerase (non-hydrolyzing) [Pseudenhygromyxa sp. WMMC2535]
MVPLRVDVVAGARPNFIKVAPIMRALGRRGEQIAARLVYTGQHYDREMFGVFVEQLELPPAAVSLGVGSLPHASQIAQIMLAYEPHLLAAPRPDWVMVVGDVNSTLACALAAAKLGIRVAHVEAGLRAFDPAMPEELNRKLTDALAQLLLVSDPAGVDNLAREGVAPEQVVYVGNVMIDTLVAALPAARALDMPARLELRPGGYAYATFHRPANVDARPRLGQLCAALIETARRLPVVFAVHPRTRARLEQFELWEPLRRAPGLRLLDPQGYLESAGLLADAAVAITDSGGIQEESCYLGVPCLVMRETTERPVTLRAGHNLLLGAEPARLPAAVEALARDPGPRPQTAAIEGWDGRAAERIVDALSRSHQRAQPSAQ